MKTNSNLFQAWLYSGRAGMLLVFLGQAYAGATLYSDANWISMNPGIPGADDTVLATAVDGSGNLYIGGDFTVVGGVVANRVAKWNGASWSALGSGFGGPSDTVYALAVSGADLYAGGRFTTADGTPANYIAKWNGTSWSAVGLGLNDTVLSLAVSGNDLYVGGHFTRATNSNGASVNVNYIAKWDGKNWSALGSGIAGTAGFNPVGVYALAASGSDLYAGGQFSTAGGTPANYIAKWNGSTWSGLGAGMNEAVFALAVSGSDLYAGGRFSSVDGNPSVLKVAKWNGSTWSPLGMGIDWIVYALAVSGGDLYVGGDYSQAGGELAGRLARWDGSSWHVQGLAMNSYVHALAASGSDLYAGGRFTSVGETPVNPVPGTALARVGKWNGNTWSALGSGINQYVATMAAWGSDLYIGGHFTWAGGNPANFTAKWNGSTWGPLGSGMGAVGFFPAVLALAVSDTNLYAGGLFSTAGGNPAAHIAKWNGNTWSPLGLGMSDNVLALAVSGSDLYASGSFTRATNSNGVVVSNLNFIAKWNGSTWSPMGSGLSYVALALAVSGSDLYVGGNFIRATNTSGPVTNVNANYIAKWNGSTWSALASGMNDSVSALAVSGTNLYAGGNFTRATNTFGPGINVSTNVNYIAKWDGSNWVALGSGMNGPVSALAVSGSNLYAGGSFTTAGGVVANGIAKWNGTSWTALGSGLSGGSGEYNHPVVLALTVSGNDLYVGGVFSTAGGKISPFVAHVVLGDAPGYNHLTWTRLSSDAIQFSYIGDPAARYALDRTFNLAPPITWLGQRTNTMTVSGVLTFSNTPAPGTNNFWRIRSVP